jgi:predicted phage-related endonuclease
MKEDVEKQIAELENDIKADMDARKTEDLVAGPFKVRWTRFVSNRFDTTAFKTAHKDIYDLFVTAVESRRFTVA